MSPSVRMECIRYSKYFLVYHAHLAGEVAQHLHERFHDREEKVRMESVKVVSEAAADNPKVVPQTVSADELHVHVHVCIPPMAPSLPSLLLSPSFALLSLSLPSFLPFLPHSCFLSSLSTLSLSPSSSCVS